MSLFRATGFIYLFHGVPLALLVTCQALCRGRLNNRLRTNLSFPVATYASSKAVFSLLRNTPCGPAE
jgi:hypothetical protein